MPQPRSLTWGLVVGGLLLAVGMFTSLSQSGIAQALRRPLLGIGRALAGVRTPTVAPDHRDDVLRSQIGVLEREIAELRKTAQMKPPAQFTAVSSYVIAADLRTNNRALVIDRGANDGLVTGLAATDVDGAVLGVLSAVEADRSVVTLLGSFSLTLSAEGGEPLRLIGVAKSDFGIGVKLEWVPNDIDLVVGSTVATGGLEQLIPRGLPIGTIREIRGQRGDPLFEATVDWFGARRLPIVINVLKPTP